MWRIVGMFFSSALMTGCTFNFDVTSQRTALENQVMGTYRELDDDLILLSSVRGDAPKVQQVSKSKQRALDAKQNQDFNRDDIDELKQKQVIGEAADGRVSLLPKNISPTAEEGDLRLARQLIEEENQDRMEIWRRIIAANDNLNAGDLPEVRRTYAKLQRDNAPAGYWYQNELGVWQQKPGKDPPK